MSKKNKESKKDVILREKIRLLESSLEQESPILKILKPGDNYNSRIGRPWTGARSPDFIEFEKEN